MNEFETVLTQIIHNTIPYNGTSARVEHDETIIKALKKQISKIVRRADLGGGISIPVCPVCGKPLNQAMRFCSSCGQKLMWGDCDD